MKQYFLNSVLIAGFAFAVTPVLAQKEKDNSKEKDVETIVITRKGGNAEEKTIIELKGNTITINGKDANKTEGVTVNVHKIKGGAAAHLTRGSGRSSFIINNEGASFFSEDSNRAMLGIVTDISSKGAEITSVTKESAAEKAGLKKGDIITGIGNKKITASEDVTTAIRAHKPGDKVAITYLRDGKEQKTTAELSKWKGMRFEAYGNPGFNIDDIHVTVPAPPAPPLPRGLSMSTNRPKLGLSIQDTEDGKGVKVMDVEETGNAAKAGIKKNDIITHVDNEEVNSTDEIRRLTTRSSQQSSYSFKVLRNGKPQTIEVRVPRKLKTADL